jgi:beta-1,2-mannosidase
VSGTGDWQLAPFTRHDGAILRDLPHLTFRCPVSGEDVAWAAKDVFNPGAVVRDGRVHLLIRGEDAVGRYAGTSRIGLAVSDDGIDFTVDPEPVLFPDDDRWQAWEWPGGCEDPRVVESPDGGYVCTYSGFDGRTPTLMVATSDDLRTWVKQGPAFAGTSIARRSSKSGSIVTSVQQGRLMATRVDGRHWMYWGEGTCFAATSDDLVRWTPLEFDATGDRYLGYAPDGAAGSWDIHRVPGQRVLRPLLFPRHGRFDSLLVEPGPPALLTDDGIVLIANGANHPEHGDPSLPGFAYQPGQILFDTSDPASCIARPVDPFLRPDGAEERHGQVGNVCFAQALVLLADEWLLYFGMADSRIGCARAPAATPI